jgi:ABC-type proline/glycine betaine transport system permease subunit/glycine betaine/choline ABC-type transport system substrate-binding protein
MKTWWQCFQIALLSVLLWLFPGVAQAQQADVRVGSKMFTESYVLGELAAQLLESAGFTVERQLGLGGSLVTYEALKAGAIDLYPAYTGTLAQAVLGRPGLDRGGLERALAEEGLQMQVFLGFVNNYAIGVNGPIARANDLQRVSQLVSHPELRAGFSHEFLNREDGWPALRVAYQLPQQPVGVEHALAYTAIETGQLDFTDAYTTDGELTVRDLVLLEDDLGFFPEYSTVLLTRTNLPADVAAALSPLQGLIDESSMQALNHAVASGGESPTAVAARFLRERGLVQGIAPTEKSRAQRILGYTARHIKLTGIALLLACIIAIPGALLLARFDRLARTLLYITGLVQTIPALALLALLIPLVGLGQVPAIIALFLYSLLPIVRNTLTGLFNVDPLVKEAATGMGLTNRQRLWHIELPLAMPTLLAGVKTAAVVSIGTATLAAFVGAGGLGEPIITGLNLNNHGLILEGALPAAALAIGVELLFEWLERALIPAHLRD